MNQRADLHLHTTASDGVWTPSQLIDAAAAAGLAAVAVTDHDTVAGIAEALARGAAAGIEVVPGIELSVGHGDTEVHLLGYYIDWQDERLLSALERLRASRHERLERMVRRLQEAGCAVSVEDVLRAAGGGSPGRPHVARVLVERGYAASVPDAFDRWLTPGRPGYVPRSRISLAEGIALIHAAGGIAVCAHPGLLREQAIVEEAVRLGVDGIEVVHSEHRPEQQAHYDAFARARGLIRTGGSDAHGPGVKKGLYLGEYTVPMEWVRELQRLVTRA